ncbi:MAG: HAD family hydrolase [Alphaproteobacteria bacterium]|nr:HAD family hydrolase [Alphaproteobacteria bacterium]
MKNALPSGVIFDWDNTLVDSWAAIAEAINYVRGKYGLTLWDRRFIQQHCTRSARESFPEWFGDLWQDAWDDYYTYFDKVRSQMGITEAYGATPLLAWLKEKAIPSVVVSNKSGHYLRLEAEQMGWKDYFEALVGAHDAPYDKPHRAHADQALLSAGLEGGPDIWFVGDTEADVACARNAACTPVLVGADEEAKRLLVSLSFRDCEAVLDELKRREAGVP